MHDFVRGLSGASALTCSPEWRSLRRPQSLNMNRPFLCGLATGGRSHWLPQHSGAILW